MPACKVTFEFESTVGRDATSGSRSGWSESWYRNNVADVPTAIALGLVLKDARRRLLTRGWSLSVMRVSMLTNTFLPTRNGALVFVPLATQPGLYFGPADTIDEQPYDALEIAVQGLAGKRRAFQIRGIGNDVVNAGARFLNPPTFNAAFPLWLGTLNGGATAGGPGTGWAIRYRTAIVNGTITAIWIGQAGSPVGATPLSPVIDAISTAAPGAGSLLRIKSATGMTRINGTWTVFTGAANPVLPNVRVYLTEKRRTTVAGTAVLTGGYTNWSYGLDNIVLATPGYGCSRRTGRPLQLTRGRRSNRN